MDDAQAARKRKRGRTMTVRNINVEGASGVPANQVIEVKFSSTVNARTVNPAVFQVREENATGTGFTKQIFGDFQISGSTIRFYPRLPTHLRDPSDPDNNFYGEGTPQDNAAENAGLKPSKSYELKIFGRPFVSPIKATNGRPLRRTFSTRFQTASAADPASLYTTRTYGDNPPPQVSFTNPPDKVPSAGEQYARFGGAADVPTDVAVSVFGTRVPISPTTIRVVGNVEFELVSRRGNPDVRRPIDGSVFLEQNFNTSLLVFKPKVPLADQAQYALRISKNVKDLTEQYDFQANRDRDRLRRIYDSLASARALEPNLPCEMLPDPPLELTGDWPESEEERGVLKCNVLAIGDTYPDEIDPRVMVLLQTRDEPVTNASLKVDFLKSEGLFDARLSTGEVDNPVTGVPSAASAILTIAGGSAVDGDLLPSQDTTLSSDNFPGGVMNFRDVVIPQGVTVTFTGSGPIQLRAINFSLAGEIDVSGSNGEQGSSSNRTGGVTAMRNNYADAGRGGPGGGDGGEAGNNETPTDLHHVKTGSVTPPTEPGVDPEDQVQAGKSGLDSEGDTGLFGGTGGLGGFMSSGTYYSYSGAGGGGGARDPGEDGTAGAGFTASWNGAGGKGGLGSDNDTLDPLVGGAGGGAGGNGVSSYPNWVNSWGRKSGSSGAGGGGAINIQVARVLNITATGRVLAEGGRGGNQTSGSYGPGGASGGGGGGSVLLRSGTGFNLAAPNSAVSVAGGSGGTGTTSYGSTRGGDGGDGYLRLEDPFGGMIVGSGSSGVFDPVGGGVPSFVYTKFTDLGVDDPRILEFVSEEVTTDPAGNDAVRVEVQMTREDPFIFGVADVSAIDDDTQESTNLSVTSNWLPVKMHDFTGIPGGAIPTVGYDPVTNGLEAMFPVAETLNGKGYRFVRYRVVFQLDQAHSRVDPIPSLGEVVMRFQFNF